MRIKSCTFHAQMNALHGKTNFFRLQVKQLRNRADEDARLVHMSLQMDSELPSSLRKDLEHLMTLVSLMHLHDLN